ncbi:MAG: Rv3654c family TadE-like protein [Actinomycetes bacterium]
MTGQGGDHGSGSVLVLAVCAALLIALAAAGVLLAAVVARHHAQSAADLAALAAADALVGRRPGPPCEEAATAAAVNDARLSGCDVSDGVSAVVRVSVTPAGPARLIGQASAVARAGPGRSDPSGSAPWGGTP